jgi:adenosylcobinamide kinase/adenosylcobinamide-phosphate guanylyltransferase
VFIVSNEVGEGVVPAYESGRAFREALGEINQKVARIANRVVLMVAGYPVAVKGA